MSDNVATVSNWVPQLELTEGERLTLKRRVLRWTQLSGRDLDLWEVNLMLNGQNIYVWCKGHPYRVIFGDWAVDNGNRTLSLGNFPEEMDVIDKLWAFSAITALTVQFGLQEDPEVKDALEASLIGILLTTHNRLMGGLGIKAIVPVLKLAINQDGRLAAWFGRDGGWRDQRGDEIVESVSEAFGWVIIDRP